ncbi:hypothetical protein F442_22634 [Phytophthora nicotianae P10297]|uniref:Uncharacterized protein n=2 Tax=Phytophthora nicotianae TaxID=4792 RepID=W2XZD1_PHYNI|nr:hypothetical protein F442_22634 [Phytophthora nicotianae P10297]
MTARPRYANQVETDAAAPGSMLCLAGRAPVWI